MTINNTLFNALYASFLSRADIELILSFRLNKRLNDVTKSSNRIRYIRKIIEWAESEGKLLDLMISACNYKPKKKELREALAQLIEIEIVQFFEKKQFDEFMLLCYDHFPELYNQFNKNWSPQMKIQALAKYCSCNLDQAYRLNNCISIYHI